MDKKLLIVGAVGALVAVMSGAVFASITPYDFSSTVTWGGTYGQQVTYASPWSYSQNAAVQKGDQVSNWELELQFLGDNDADHPANVDHRANELVTVSISNYNDFRDAILYSLGEVNNGYYTVGSDVTADLLQWLNDDGQVWIRVSVGYNNQDAYVKSSVLTGQAIAPVPLPTSLLLGVAAVGLAGRKLRQFV